MQKTEIDDYGVETIVRKAPAKTEEKKDPVKDAEEVDEEDMYGEAVEYTKKAESTIVPKVESQWQLSQSLVVFNKTEFVYYDFSKKNSSWQTGDMTDNLFVPDDSATSQVLPTVHGSNEFSAIVSGGYHNGMVLQDVVGIKFTQEEENAVSYVNCSPSSYMPAMHQARYMHGQAIVKGKSGAWTLLAIGGKSDSKTWLNTVESLDLTNYLRPGKTVKDASGKIVQAQQALWQPVSGMAKPRSNFGVMVVQNSVYVVGGFQGVTDTHHPKMADIIIEKYQPQFDKWTEYSIPNVPSLACFAYAPMYKEGQMAILGGTDGMIMQQDLLIIDFKGDGQCMQQQTNFEYCTSLGKLVYHEQDKKLYCIGGFNSNGASYSLKLGENEWNDYEHSYKLVSGTIDAELMHNPACFFN